MKGNKGSDGLQGPDGPEGPKGRDGPPGELAKLVYPARRIKLVCPVFLDIKDDVVLKVPLV